MSILSGNSTLKSGYSTGTCASAAFAAALRLYMTGKYSDRQTLVLPNRDDSSDNEGERSATLAIEELRLIEGITDNVAYASVRKPGNDDQDVTKNVLIMVHITANSDFFAEMKNPVKHSARTLAPGIFLYAGRGTGVTTLPGLKVPVGLPAVNPGPLGMMKKIASAYVIKGELHILVSVENGEEVAKQTANEKVGVIGGISILGSRGIVKPLSNEAYLQSVEAEISVALELHDSVCFALGNTSVSYALKSGLCERENLIETGNFVKDSLYLLKGRQIKTLTFVAGTGKMARVALGYGNTHSHRGPASPADIASLPGLPGSTFDHEDFSSHSTFRAMEESLQKRGNNEHETVLVFVVTRAREVFEDWIHRWNQSCRNSDLIQVDSLCLILLDFSGHAHRICDRVESTDSMTGRREHTKTREHEK